ncbi:hypothetical protein FRB94_004689 [Tulasnella sp. JGI-2019a]|nr:hypothetical protein FRB94_004689 [Tulasnella sp. JGI-2019a]KAG9006333.1 hypothetical protein FRB93_008822 [Tulasnella sp. JGI-2019a]KAG9038002.1 hypothetical protein FRB95_003395 [Tulasnella sp. JGI-2019a]
MDRNIPSEEIATAIRIISGGGASGVGSSGQNISDEHELPPPVYDPGSSTVEPTSIKLNR